MNTSRILLGLMLIVGAGTAVATGTSAFFSDTESSVGNIFTAGAIDLLVDNDSYYNGNHCAVDASDVDADQNTTEFVWQGNSGFPEVGTSCDTSWPEGNLNNGETTLHKFFNFADVKPSDDGEDTISFHVQNDAWMCMDVSLTSNDDNTCNTPESEDDPTCSEPDADENDGELAGLMQMVWWEDDGDNVLETDETILAGVGSVQDLTASNQLTLALADADNNAWGEGAGTPVPANVTKYIAKAWCFGGLATTPVTAGEGVNPGVASGITCNGDNLDNAAQTDELTLDVEFRAVQARNNEDFLCDPIGNATLTLVKAVNNGGEGSATGSEWTLSASGPSNISGASGSGSVTAAAVIEGNYNLSESGGIPGYVGSTYSCVVNGGPAVIGNSISLAENDVAVCTITNTVNACSVNVQYADAVVNANQGVRKDGSLILADRRNPGTALGAPQTTGTPSDASVLPNSFFALGFNVGTTTTRSITLNYTNNVILNGPGADVKVFEVTGGVYPDEHVKVEVSQDGTNWFVAAADVVRDANVDINGTGLAWAKYVRLTDINVVGPFPNDADGYDVDAVEALNCGAGQPAPAGPQGN